MNKLINKTVTLGVIVGNRGFFPGHLCETGRKTILDLLKAEGINAIALSPEDTKYGSVESVIDAQKGADLFKKHRDEIDGILITLPNFGDERAIANTIRWSGLDVPVLVHAFPDDVAKMTILDRRDSFCGKMSACNNLRQYGINYSLTTLHTVDPLSESFKQDLRSFVSVCRIVKGLKGARLGLIGARPTNFNTVRFSEKLLERAGISVETLDLSEVLGRIERLPDDHQKVKEKLANIRAYIPTKNVPTGSILRMAKFGAVVDSLDGSSAACRECGAMLDSDGRVLRDCSLHADEHDEQPADAIGLRDGYCWIGRNAGDGIGFRQTQRDC